jgi:hypothetical protein
MSTPLKPPGEWQSLQVSRGSAPILSLILVTERGSAEAGHVADGISSLESWQAVQVAAFGEITSQAFDRCT